MISTKVNIECLTRLGMLRFFPTKEAIIAEIGKYLNQTCDTDHEARAVIEAFVTRYSEWMGPRALQDIRDKLRAAKADEVRKDRERKERLRLSQERDAHEATCPGYRVHVDEAERYIGVSPCTAYFGPITLFIGCRKGDQLSESDPKACERILSEELAARGVGWRSERDYWNRAFRKRIEHDG